MVVWDTYLSLNWEVKSIWLGLICCYFQTIVNFGIEGHLKKYGQMTKDSKIIWHGSTFSIFK